MRTAGQRRSYTADRANQALEYLFSYWDDIDALSAEWDQLSVREKIDFANDVGIPNSLTNDLAFWHQHGQLTTSQEQRYTELLQVIAEKRPIQDRLLELDNLIQLHRTLDCHGVARMTQKPPDIFERWKNDGFGTGVLRAPDPCFECAHYHGEISRQCDAFPDRIPDEIWMDHDPHTQPFPGDHGIQFEPKEPIAK